MTPWNCAISILRGVVVQAGSSNLNNLTILQLCIFLLAHALALVSSRFIHIFRHFYIIEKLGKICIKQSLKVLAINSDLYFCLFDPYIPSYVTVLGKTVIQTVGDRNFFFSSFQSSFLSSRVLIFSWILLTCGFNLEKIQNYPWHISYLPVDTNFFRILKFLVEVTILKKWG